MFFFPLQNLPSVLPKESMSNCHSHHPPGGLQARTWQQTAAIHQHRLALLSEQRHPSKQCSKQSLRMASPLPSFPLLSFSEIKLMCSCTYITVPSELLYCRSNIGYPSNLAGSCFFCLLSPSIPTDFRELQLQVSSNGAVSLHHFKEDSLFLACHRFATCHRHYLRINTPCYSLLSIAYS